MRKLLLFLLVMMLASVGVSQDTQSRVYTLTGPTSQPTASYARNGTLVLLTSPEGYRVLNATTNAQLWFVPAVASGSRANVAFFSRDSASVWALTNPSTGEVSEFVALTGAFKRKFNLFAAGTNPVNILPLGTTIVGTELTNPKVNGVDVYQLDVKSYNTADLTLLQTKSLVHTSAGLDPRWAFGVRGTRDVVTLFQQELDVRTGAIRSDVATVGADNFEYWTIGVDKDSGLEQIVARKDASALSGFTVTGIRRLNDLNVVRFTRAIADVGGTLEVSPIQFAFLPNDTYVGITTNKAGTLASVINWATGVRLYDVTLPGVVNSLHQVSTATGIVRGRYYVSYPNGPGQPNRPGSFVLGNTSAGSISDFNFISRGASMSAEVGALGTVVAGKGPFLALYDTTGALKWSLTNLTPLQISAPSATTGNVLAILAGKLSVRSFTNGAELASLSGDFTSAAWIGDTKIIVAQDDGTTTVLNFTGSSLTTSKFFEALFTDSLSVSPDGNLVAGYNADQFKVVNLTSNAVVGTTVGNVSTVGKRIDWTANNVVALAENSSAKNITWRFFTVGTSLVEGTPFTHTISTAGTVTQLRTAISPDGKLAAFGGFGSQGADGVFLGEVSIRRLSDGKLLGRFLDQLPGSIGLRFSTNSRFLTDTFGTAASQTGDVAVLDVPNYVVSAVGGTAQSGGNISIPITLNQPAKTGQKVSITSANATGWTFPSEITIGAGRTTQSVTFTAPIVAVAGSADFTIKTSDQSSDIASTTINVKVLAPQLFAFTATPTPIVGSSADVVLNYTVFGKIATATSPLTFTSSNPTVINPPATGTITTGSTGSVTAPTTRVATTTSVTLSAKLGLVTRTAVVSVIPPALTGISVVDAPTRGGDDATFRLTLRAAAPAAGEPITVTTEGPDGTSTFTVTVPATKTTVDFTVPTPTVSTAGNLKVTAKSAGSADFVVNTAINPSELAFFSLSASSIQGGKSVKGLIVLDGPAGASTSVSVSSNSARATVPATVSVSNGLTFAEFTVNTTAGARQSVTITVTMGTKTFTKTLIVLP